jgi:hypothetical protein
VSYTCAHCEHETEPVRTITEYDENGVEERLTLLCPSCYEEWLLSLKG